MYLISPYIRQLYIVQSGAATCSEGFVICFLEAPLACLSSITAAVQPNSLWNSQKTFYKTFRTSCCPRLYLTSYQHIELDKLHPILYLRARIRRETVALLTAGGGRGIVIGRIVIVMLLLLLLLLLLLCILGGSGGWRIRRKSRVAGCSGKKKVSDQFL